MKSKKHDGGKLRWDLLPIKPIEEIVKVLTFGARKYGENNWQGLDNAQERYYAALMRHITAWRKGYGVDRETRRSHLAHAGCCLIYLIWFERGAKR